MQFPLFTDLERVYWAQNDYVTRDNYLLPIQNKISSGVLPDCSVCQSCSVWSDMPAASLPLFCICFWAPCIPFTHSDTCCTITGPLGVQAGGRYLPSVTEQPCSRLCSLTTGILLLQLLILKLT